VQGERPMASQNKSLGTFNLDGIPPAPRGVPQIEVTFDIDANGILNVSAKDKGTGKSHNIRIEAGSGLTKEEIEKMKNEAKANEAADKAEREKIDKLNQADSLIFQTEKQLKEYGDKISRDKKAPIESALQKLKDAHKTQNLSDVDSSIAALNAAWTTASEEMYKASQGGPQGNDGQANGQGQQEHAESNAGGDNVTDAEFEEVK
jgi:molecular chaperone DnaK